jgi:8-oxo-dGTP pyrophosphatase MutT (NUDIX family)
MSDPQPWKILSSRYVYERRPYLAVREDKVDLGDGRTIDDYFVFEYPEWVIVLAVTADDRFVVIRQYRHGHGSIHYELCAGTIEPGENLLETARRELLEETGYGGGRWQEWLVASANPGTHTNLAHIFLATGVEWRQHAELDETEDISVHLLTRVELLHEMETGGMIQALHLAALWKYLYRSET